MAIAVIVNGGGGGIEPMAPMAVSLIVAAVDGGSNNSIFTNASHNNACHPHPHRPCPPLDKDQMVEWRAHCDLSHSSFPRLLSLVPSLSPLTG